MSETARNSRVGTVFGHYQLVKLLGRGGMGEVYEAYDTTKDRTVALKLLPENLAADARYRERFRRESHTAARLLEPHIIPIHDFGEIDGLLYIDMRLIRGEDLGSILSRDGPLPPSRAVGIIGQIAAALDAAHADGLIHRDIKPANILVADDDFSYLVDFGIARSATGPGLTSTGTAIGTYAYMAPERFRKGEITSRTDVYSLACVLHECITGTRPFPGNSVQVVIKAHLFDPIPHPSRARRGIPAAFDDVIARGMAKDPADRYARAGDLFRAAHDALGDTDRHTAATILGRNRAPILSAPRQPSEPLRPRKRWRIGTAVVAVLLVVSVAAGIWLANRSNRNGPTAAITGSGPPTSAKQFTPAELALVKLVPPGNDEHTCSHVDPPPGGTAKLYCVPGGKPFIRDAFFSQYGTVGALRDGYTQWTSGYSAGDEKCPDGSTPGPYTAHGQDQATGQVACLPTLAAIVWTTEPDLVLSIVFGNDTGDLPQLFTWWQQQVGST
ncbi:serine/threonine-protein kinase [Nocardia sp. NPDC004860]|uniref:serine/threonine-protein kinase n=1 Tax=Nocardia sp. NPDC004860 TaxID=3154557 RepID=UPI0033A6EAA9